MDRAGARRLVDDLIGKEVGSWRIVDLVNHGKSAAVFRGEANGLRAAVKVFDPELIEEFGRGPQLARIRREVELKGHSHPHLVEIYDGGECPKTKHLYVTMQLFEYPNLAAVLRDVPRDRIAGIVAQMPDPRDLFRG